ncbi:MAG TPA: cbb3-type cytochrome c oxidase subunit II [Opitutaceae bacterium]|jgi:cytochrome c oxidase cbb3-type subunit 2|nr:cbb3-type cytochrome c oxidase subunit II [Opitutaceae bacterium]
MKNGLMLFLGLLAAMLIPWSAIVLGANHELGRQPAYYDDNDSQAYPLRPSGIAAEGEQVYRGLNCAACHTQQVRRDGYGSDVARGWGDRQSVARDYIFRANPELGALRIGPDLANLAGRKPTAPDIDDLYTLLYEGQGAMPPYRFLFQYRKIIGQRSDDALQLVGRYEPRPGYEVVPTRAAQRLAGYLLSLNSTYTYPEARAAAPAAGEGRK